MADSAALLAENEELKAALASEREQAAKLVEALNGYRAACEAEIALLKEQNAKLEDQAEMFKAELERQKRRGTARTLLGVLGGIGIGLLF